MFRSARHARVFPQAEHARLAAAIAEGWDIAAFPIAGVPLELLVRGVAEHDRGYGEMDDDAIGEVTESRWLSIQRAGFVPREDPVVDLVVAMHIRRLVGWSRTEAALATAADMDARLPELQAAAGLTHAQAIQVDRVTHLCDMVAFDLCLEEPENGTVAVTRADGVDQMVAHRVDGLGGATIDPWPLVVTEVEYRITAYHSDSYPDRPQPQPVDFTIAPVSSE